MRVFIGTLYSGETEFPACEKSVSDQLHPDITHEVIENLPNREAHETLYRRFMQLRPDYDLFIKLDADMEFMDDEVVSRFVAFFEQNPDLDHLSTTVHDYYTDSSVFGVHCYSSRCQWSSVADDLFVDPFPLVPGRRLLFRCDHASRNMVRHAFGQSDRDACAFGHHKVAKLLQVGQARVDYRQVGNHWRNLRQLSTAYRRSGGSRRRIALCGACDALEAARSGEPATDYDSYKAIGRMPASESRQHGRFISSDLYQTRLIVSAMGWSRILGYAIRSLRGLYKSESDLLGLEKAPESLCL